MAKTQMLINYVPGDECRVAIVEDGKLEEYHAEPTENVSRVNNIYVGRVRNVEASIQAAFVDFGVEEAGFLHISDLHPMYFPGEDEETTERVGKKTPRRERPPIQQALKRGQEIVVQVLKEGVGTKGPTLTSYLSIPGRYLVMMPQMDKVGVSRKVEDEDLRKQMRDILSQLELPEGFGFILRTAGLERTKTELKRDLAYLQRLWKDMERRRKQGNKPRLLYSESDLLVRALRDLLGSEVDEVVIDHPAALSRAAQFMKIVAPRAQAKLMQYVGERPMYHAFGIEPQILTMHSQEVPLPSGGRLVIDEAEALVAIDVNSGKMRSAKDAETNAFKVNMEAVDEICRQLRLRDLGGLVIHDLIDMRSASNRKKVEQRMRERLKRDRARTTVLPISAFGIMEMTRQRMRGSHERVHFTECPTCRGRGLVQRPDSVAADALRELGSVLSHPKVHKVELAVGPRVAGVLLSGRRQALNQIERQSGKSVHVRISDALPVDRVGMYAYDDSGADLNIEKLEMPRGQPPTEPWTDEAEQDWAVDLLEEAEEAARQVEEATDAAMRAEAEKAEAMVQIGPIADEAAEPGEGKRKRRRRRRRRKKTEQGAESPGQEGEAPAGAAEPAAEDAGGDEDQSEGAEAARDGETTARKHRRRRRRRKGSARQQDGEGETAGDARDQPPADEGAESSAPEEPTRDDAEQGASPENEAGAKKKKRRRRKSKKPGADAGRGTEGGAADAGVSAGGDDAPTEPAKKKVGKKKPRRRSKASGEGGEAKASGEEAKAAEAEAAPKKKPRPRKKTKAGGEPKGAAGDAAPPPEPKPGATPGGNGQAEPTRKAKPRRSLYGGSRRKLGPSERGRPREE